MKFKWVMMAMTATTLGSCYNDNMESLNINKNGCDTTNITFSKNIRPIIDQQCASCHASGVYQTLGGSYNLDGYANVKGFADPNGLLIKSVIGDPSVSQRMPPIPASKLSDCQISQIQQWINGGASNN